MKELKEYRSKRDFSVTREPKGRLAKTKRGKLRYAMQRHAARADHYDLRLELDGVALSWAVPKGPSYDPRDKRLAVRVEDHPVDYMGFEGTIPKGEYGGGTVMLWDEGEWKPRTNPQKGLEDGSLKFTLEGERLKGDWALVRMKTEEKQDTWLLIKEKDAFAKKSAGISRFTRGVRSGKTMEEIAQSEERNPFSGAEVMLAQLCGEPPAGTGWLYELKYDGHRTLAFSEQGKTILKTRNGYDCTASYPAAAQGVSDMLKGRAAVLDGEMVVVGKDGLPDFGALQSYRPQDKGLCYVLFDLLSLDGVDLRGLPLIRRKQKLETLMKNASGVLSYSAHSARMTARQLEAVRARGMEGVVIKRADSPYTAGKNGDWRKLKFRNVREFVIGGYLTGDAGELKTLLVGFYEGKALHYIGKVGTGFSDRTRQELKKKLSAQMRKTSPFISSPKQKNAVWVRPKLAAQVEYAEITAAGQLRQASFKGLRQDKELTEITDERPIESVSAPSEAEKAPKRVRAPKKEPKEGETKVCGVTITHPEKVMFHEPEVTKLDLVKYYAAVAPRMLPYVKGRLLSLICCPSGTEGEKFFRRHLEGDFEGVGAAGEEDNFFVTSAQGLVSLAQYNAVEFHVHGSKKGTPRPDVMVFDLDPDEGLPLSEVRKGVRALRDVLDKLGLKSFLKTSGGKGYHIVVPFREGVEEQRFRNFARQVAELMESAYPKLFTSNVSKRVRKGKIYLDWQRNSPGATSAAPYSVRARAGAPVSMPITWEELGKVAPASITLSMALKRLRKPDPWKDFFAVKSSQRLRFRGAIEK